MTKTQLNAADSHTDERQAVSESQSVSSCPKCDGRVIRDDEHGETTCDECGLVVNDMAIDRGPERRAFDGKEKDKKAASERRRRNSCTTRGSARQSTGKITSMVRQSPIRTEPDCNVCERFRTKDAHERNLKQALGEISRMASALDVPVPVRETAGVLYRRAVNEDLFPSRSIKGMTTASLYAAARQHSEFAEVSRVEKIQIQRAYRYLFRELGLKIEPTDPLEYVPQFASALDVSDAVHASMVTIRNRYQELIEVYGDAEVYAR